MTSLPPPRNPMAFINLMDALREFRPDERHEKINNALQIIEKKERDESFNEEFAKLSTEDKETLLSYRSRWHEGQARRRIITATNYDIGEYP
jgi:hypothetical protein